MRIIRIATILTVTFWLIVAVQQTLWIPHAVQPRFINSPLIGSFARRYVVTSSVEIALFAAVAFALLVCVYRIRRVWPPVALCVLFAFTLWRYFVHPLPIFFRAPLGDGSLHGAFAGYLRFHSGDLWLDITKTFLVIGCLGLWAAVSYHISHAHGQEV
jgi:hypothetical protein